MKHLRTALIFFTVRCLCTWLLWNAIAPTYLPEPWSHVTLLHAGGMLLIYGAARAKLTLSKESDRE